jgi:4a-hydroxytetrahydrobiopterin dehydratase
MATQARISDSEIQAALPRLAGWKLNQGKLEREYKFADFTHAFGFMAAAATVAEAMGHHPDWSNSYNRVKIELTTHDAGGITKKDLELAGKFEELARKLQ